ncbi:exonuclease DPD1, chloroplastic/mitochondrial [Actinidia eriantha]|uniref:exonuclease DPD1, chloroplastic/mitochondrial n=1 Tax=Actinidia eriantha TaxID=165200 RepID=UPI00258BFD1F|nr:exonuclease DPD1, chloroplastic/mitochondrial [Actinidia eriantha]
MRTVAMCFSILPRCGIHVLASSQFKGFHSLSRPSGNGARFGVFGSSTHGHEGGHSRGWSRKPITTKTEGRKKKVLTRKTSDLVQEISDVSITTGTMLNITKPEISEYQRIQYCDTQQKIDESRDLVGLITVIVFDLETTGISRENERIIEIALQDLVGGENSTFQTLVNPERDVWNEHIHNISTHMVRKPGVPRMKDLIPILLQYVESRRKPGGLVLWVAHNARRFDVPFLINEFSRCSFDIPRDWLFMDTVPLAREAMKSEGSKRSSVSLEALREHYKIPLVGRPHRAMSDVNMLSLILRRLTFDLKLPISGLVERSFTASDLINVKKKKKSSG